MIKQEEIILMEALLRDVRGNWSDEIISRLTEANRIAKSHNFEAIEKKTRGIIDAEMTGNNKNFDGRCFRSDYKSGGYEGLSEFYGGDGNFKLKARSKEFLQKVDELMTNDWLIFPDFDEYNQCNV
ncbi:hypothetical protein ABEW22_19090 [Bacillus velezensis]|uniref:hypothetical protein n=1 Tax=Bacillus velezensis TaxID=492670 RepID=UPI000DC4DB0F|nr:hypothetical protein [Bacillus velezensis]AZJ44173.1 hypothetical protein EG882_13165 [Bacillus velezensis]RAP14879.1 hypothetical protein HS9_00203 [Bacillus velezensis]